MTDPLSAIVALLALIIAVIALLLSPLIGYVAGGVLLYYGFTITGAFLLIVAVVAHAISYLLYTSQ